MTKEDSEAWAGSVSDALGESGLDVLINNAGILTPGPIEVLPLDAIRREFDVKTCSGPCRSSTRSCRR